MASSSAMTTRVANCVPLSILDDPDPTLVAATVSAARLCHELVEQLVLRPLEPVDLLRHGRTVRSRGPDDLPRPVGTVLAPGLGVPSGLPMLRPRQWRLGDERPEARVVR